MFCIALVSSLILDALVCAPDVARGPSAVESSVGAIPESGTKLGRVTVTYIPAPGKEGIKHYIITDEKLTMDCEHHDAKFYVDDPPTPFVRALIGELHEGTVIEIHGMMHDECTPLPGDSNSLYIDLRKSTVEWKEETLAPFHIGVRNPSTKAIALNSYDHCGWQEQVDHEGSFRGGEKFHIVIQITSTGYLVTINDFIYPEFHKRHDVRDVHAISIGGVVNLSKVSIKNLEEPADFEDDANAYSEGLTNQIEICHNNDPVLLQLNQESPLNCTIAGGMICRKLVFKGIPFSSHARFEVNFKEANSNDIAFHFQVRFDQQTCVMNSFESGCWKEEFVINSLPFEYNKEFMLTFFCDNTEFVVFKEDHKMASFCHRLPPYKISFVKIDEGVKILALALLPGYSPST